MTTTTKSKPDVGAAAVPALPSPEELDAALAPFLLLPPPSNAGVPPPPPSASGAWRALVQRALSYGTGGDRFADEAGAALAEALGRRRARLRAAKEEGREEKEGGLEEKEEEGKKVDDEEASWWGEDPAVRTVVEAAWLAGCLLDPDGGGELAGKKADATTEDDGGASHARLASIVRRLASPLATPGGDDGGGGDAAPAIPVRSLQASLELPLLAAAGLLPAPPAARPRAAAGRAAAEAAAKGGGGKAKDPSAAASAASADFARKKLKKINTDLHYRQRKFNLLAEEGEGYAKLVALLFGGLGEGEGGGGPRTRVRELIGAFDLDPNRVLDLALDALERELDEVASRPSAGGGGSKPSSSSFADLAASTSNKKWYGLRRLRSALASAGEREVRTIEALVAVIKELDGEGRGDDDGDDDQGEEDGRRRGRAAAHLLGFKYRSYRSAAAAKREAAKGTTEGDHASALPASAAAAAPSEGGAVVVDPYPRSLHLVAAFLSVRGILDPHDLIPHLVAASSAASDGAGGATQGATKNAGGGAATPLLAAHDTYRVATIKRLRRLGVVSLNSAKSSKGDDDDAKDVAAKAAEEALAFDPVVGIHRALLALGGGWDDAAAFLADAADPGGFADLVERAGEEGGEGGGAGGSEEDPLRAAMDAAASAACALREDVAGDVRAWTSAALGTTTAEEGEGEGEGKAGDRRSAASVIPVVGDAKKVESLADLSATLRSPLTCLVRSGAIRGDRGLYVRLCRAYGVRLAALAATKKEPKAAAANPPSSSSSSPDDDDGDGDRPPPEEVDAASVDDDAFAVLSDVLVPSLSLFAPDPALAGELWSALRVLPYRLRYRLYAAWRRPGLEKGALRAMAVNARSGNVPTKPLGIVESEIETGIAARYVLKRISKENVEEVSRERERLSDGRNIYRAGTHFFSPEKRPRRARESAFSRLSYRRSVFFAANASGGGEVGADVAQQPPGGLRGRPREDRELRQHDLDDGGRVPVRDRVGVGRHGILPAGEPGRGRGRRRRRGGEESDQQEAPLISNLSLRNAAGGLNTEQWLASLEAFAGAFYKKFPDVELRGVLVYLAQRFREGRASELGVLRSLIKTVGGYGYADCDSTAALSDPQLDGRCGSRHLRRETSSFGVVDDINRRASRKLRAVLQGGDLGAAVLVLLARMRSTALYSKPSETVREHVKVRG
ncbi:hypothetical protein ACHAWF_005888, partial [Thalassiosira exigua]